MPTQVGNKPSIPPGGADTFVTGGAAWANVSNTPFRNHKQTNHEGGIASPLIVRWTTDAQADDRVIVACTDPVVRWRIIGRPDIASIEQLKGKRLGYSGYGAVTHYVALTFSKIMGWKFPKPRGGGTVGVKYPFLLMSTSSGDED